MPRILNFVVIATTYLSGLVTNKNNGLSQQGFAEGSMLRDLETGQVFSNIIAEFSKESFKNYVEKAGLPPAPSDFPLSVTTGNGENFKKIGEQVGKKIKEVCVDQHPVACATGTTAALLSFWYLYEHNKNTDYLEQQAKTHEVFSSKGKHCDDLQFLWNQEQWFKYKIDSSCYIPGFNVHRTRCEKFREQYIVPVFNKTLDLCQSEGKASSFTHMKP